jgi:hypothetical protein
VVYNIIIERKDRTFISGNKRSQLNSKENTKLKIEHNKKQIVIVQKPNRIIGKSVQKIVETK